MWNKFEPKIQIVLGMSVPQHVLVFEYGTWDEPDLNNEKFYMFGKVYFLILSAVKVRPEYIKKYFPYRNWLWFNLVDSTKENKTNSHSSWRHDKNRWENGKKSNFWQKIVIWIQIEWESWWRKITSIMQANTDQRKREP